MKKVILPKIQGYYLIIILKDSLLILRMEEESSERTFSITLDNDSINNITFGFYNDTEQLVKGLEDAANHPGCGLILSLSPGKLIYTVHFPEGSYEESYTIDLVEQIPESDEMIKSLERLGKLEDMMGQMEKRMIQMAETFQVLQHWCAPDLNFSNSSIKNGHYILTNNNKTGKLKVEFNPWIDPLEILPQTPSSGQHSYSVKIDHINEGIYFGIATVENKKKGLVRHHVEYKYCTGNGEISGKINKKAEGKGPYGDVGSVMKMCVDMEKGILMFFVNNREVNSCVILKGFQYFAHIYLRNQDDCVTSC